MAAPSSEKRANETQFALIRKEEIKNKTNKTNIVILKLRRIIFIQLLSAWKQKELALKAKGDSAFASSPINYLDNKCFISRIPVTEKPKIKIIIQSLIDNGPTLKKLFRSGNWTINICPIVTTVAISKNPLQPLRFHPEPPVL